MSNATAARATARVKSNPLARAIAAIGGPTAAANRLQVSRRVVHHWLARGNMRTARPGSVAALAALSGVPQRSLLGLDN